jgi:ABC-type multidrug transport system fused ATPase/permease subunit
MVFRRIDGIDISTLGLEDLRTRVVSRFVLSGIDLSVYNSLQTVISQDVSLFSGTLRSNLDPFEEHSDEECWAVIDRCHLSSCLKRRSSEKDVSLSMPISQDGSLSAGERQLVALARAILRQTNIIVMDEATSQIDSFLDDQVR